MHLQECTFFEVKCTLQMVIPDTWVLKLSKVRILFESIQESKTIINFLTTPKDSLFPYPSSLNFSILRNYFVV